MFWRKKIFDGETGGGRRWLEWTGWKKGRMNMHPHSVSLHPHSVSNAGKPFSIAELGVAKEYAITDPNYVRFLQIKLHTSHSCLPSVCAGYMSNSRSLAASFLSLAFFFSPPHYSPTLSFCFFVLNFVIYFGCSWSSLCMCSSWLWVGWVVVCWILVPWPVIYPRFPAWEHGVLSTAPPGTSLISRFWCSVQSFSLSHVWLCHPKDCSMPGFPVYHQLPELAHTNVHWVGDAIQPFHPLSSPFPPAFNLSQNHGLFQWVPFLLPIQFSSANFVPVIIFWGMVGFWGNGMEK